MLHIVVHADETRFTTLRRQRQNHSRTQSHSSSSTESSSPGGDASRANIVSSPVTNHLGEALSPQTRSFWNQPPSTTQAYSREPIPEITIHTPQTANPVEHHHYPSEPVVKIEEWSGPSHGIHIASTSAPVIDLTTMTAQTYYHPAPVTWQHTPDWTDSKVPVSQPYSYHNGMLPQVTRADFAVAHHSAAPSTLR